MRDPETTPLCLLASFPFHLKPTAGAAAKEGSHPRKDFCLGSVSTAFATAFDLLLIAIRGITTTTGYRKSVAYKSDRSFFPSVPGRSYSLGVRLGDRLVRNSRFGGPRGSGMSAQASPDLKKAWIVDPLPANSHACFSQSPVTWICHGGSIAREQVDVLLCKSAIVARRRVTSLA